MGCAGLGDVGPSFLGLQTVHRDAADRIGDVRAGLVDDPGLTQVHLTGIEGGAERPAISGPIRRNLVSVYKQPRAIQLCDGCADGLYSSINDGGGLNMAARFDHRSNVASGADRGAVV